MEKKQGSLQTRLWNDLKRTVGFNWAEIAKDIELWGRREEAYIQYSLIKMKKITSYKLKRKREYSIEIGELQSMSYRN